jgi:hypothetical protein
MKMAKGGLYWIARIRKRFMFHNRETVKSPILSFQAELLGSPCLVTSVFAKSPEMRCYHLS